MRCGLLFLFGFALSLRFTIGFVHESTQVVQRPDSFNHTTWLLDEKSKQFKTSKILC